MIDSLRGTKPGRASRPARLFFLGLLASLQANAAESTPEAWLRLLHYESGSSNAAAPSFFITPAGATDPQGEYRASREELSKLGSDFHCRFPARTLLLRRLNPSLPAPSKACPEWTAFRERLGATGASLAFSSYYLNNPASAFGHSFLRIHKRSGSGTHKQAELLDTGIGYAATVTTSNSLAYAFYGIFGLFKGDYSALPYYYKVREYADAENRDLWSYELALSPTELELLVAHIWELDRQGLRYYYFSRNCSYEILAVLEAVLDPSRGKPGLLSRLPWFVIPAHTLQSLMQEPGLVRSVGYRPSLRKQLEARLEPLTASERSVARDWKNHPSAPSLGSSVLDARIDWIDFTSFSKLLKEDPEATALKQDALASRAATGVVADEKPVAPPLESEPSRGHPPRRIQITSRGRLSFRPALQDLLDPATGYPESARLEFTQVTLESHPRLRLRELSLFRAQSLAPVSRVAWDPSWKVGAALDRSSGDLGSDRLAGHFEVTGGLTLPLLAGPGWVRAFALTGTRIHLGRVLNGPFVRPALSIEAGIHSRWGDRFALLASIQRLRFVEHSRTLSSIEGRFTINPRWGVGASRKEDTWQADVSYFF